MQLLQQQADIQQRFPAKGTCFSGWSALAEVPLWTFLKCYSNKKLWKHSGRDVLLTMMMPAIWPWDITECCWGLGVLWVWTLLTPTPCVTIKFSASFTIWSHLIYTDIWWWAAESVQLFLKMYLSQGSPCSGGCSLLQPSISMLCSSTQSLQQAYESPLHYAKPNRNSSHLFAVPGLCLYPQG